MEAIEFPWETIVLGRTKVYNEGVYIGSAYVLYFQDGDVKMAELANENGELLPKGWYQVSMEDYYQLAVYSKVIQ